MCVHVYVCAYVNVCARVCMCVCNLQGPSSNEPFDTLVLWSWGVGLITIDRPVGAHYH